jgi:plasmid stabilization system protein ParE
MKIGLKDIDRPCNKYHIIFRVKGDAVIILRILHGARNIVDII